MTRTTRPMYILQMPLDGWPTSNAALSHWALLIGIDGLLCEIFPVRGPTKWTPLNRFQYSLSPDLASRQATFKFGIMPERITDRTDEEIIETAREIARANPVYNLGFYNCQTFVTELTHNIMIRTAVTEAAEMIQSWLPGPLGAWFQRGGEGEDTRSTQAASDMQALVQVGEEYRAPEAYTFTDPEAVETYSPPAGHSNEEPFTLKDVKYFLQEDEDYQDIINAVGGHAVVYGLSPSLVFDVANVPQPESLDDLAPEQNVRIARARAFVGQYRAADES